MAVTAKRISHVSTRNSIFKLRSIAKGACAMMMHPRTLAQYGGRSLSPPEVMHLVEDLNDTHEISEASARFQRFAEGCGFSHATCLKIPATDESLEACLYMSTEPKRWLDHYIERNYIQFDPLIQHAAQSSSPFFWSDADNGSGDDTMIGRLFHERSTFGIEDGLIVPIKDSMNSTTIVSYSCLGKAPREFKTELTISAHYFRNKIVALHRERIRSHALLTDREIECLKWAAQGKTDWEIGSILRVDNKTINYRIERAKKKIGVSTRVQAVIYAIRHCGI